MARKREPTGKDLVRHLPDFLQDIETQGSRETVAGYRHSITYFLSVIGDRPLDRESIGEFQRSISERAAGSRATYISRARSFCRWCQEEDLLPKSAVELLKRPKISTASRNRYLSQKEARAVVRAARRRGPKPYAVCITLATTGIRAGELARATWRDVYLDPKGHRGLRITRKGGREDEVLLTDAAWDAIVAVREAMGLKTDLSHRDKSPLIPTRTNGHYSVEMLSRIVKDAATDARVKIDEDEGKSVVSAHWLRHTMATLAILGGASVFQIQTALGHAKLETSQRYMHMVHGLSESAVRHVPPLT